MDATKLGPCCSKCEPTAAPEISRHDIIVPLYDSDCIITIYCIQ